MVHAGISVVQLRRLRGRLKRARDAAGLTQKQVATDLGWSLSKVIRIETGATTISTSDVMAMILYYKITDAAEVEELLSITRAKERSWWWDEYQEIYGRKFLDFLAYEDSATRIRQLQWLTVPGLLQTESYARTLFSTRPDTETAETDLHVRLRRQRLLTRDGGAEMFFLLDEAVIHRLVGGREVMTEQLRHLRSVNRLPHITIQIVPFAAGWSHSMGSSFTIFDLSPESEETVDYVVIEEEPRKDILVRDNPETTSKSVQVYYEVRDIALSKSDSDAMLDAAVARM
jgi:transcriptional regulator with XRE-family HTH domain